MWYVYYRHLRTGREDFVDCYETQKEAVNKIASCYIIDRNTAQKNEYYYFMKQH